MICPRCGKSIEGLACPACTALQSREAIFHSQGMHMASVHAGRLPFYAKRLSARHPWHLMLFGDRAHAYCGTEINQKSPNNRREILYKQLAELAPPTGLCAACSEALKGIEEREAIREESKS